jgi:HK97 family phage prohead protease
MRKMSNIPQKIKDIEAEAKKKGLSLGKEQNEFRAFEMAEFRAEQEDNRPVIEGHAAVYNKKTNIGDYFYEVIERGAFDGCDFDDVLFCINHETRKIPVARSRRNNKNSTMQLSTDNEGLFVKAYPDIENNSESRSLYHSIQRGDIDGMSFIFRVAEERWEDLDKPMPTRHILKFKKVFEVSAVTMPAYRDTNISARDLKALENARTALENARSKELENSNELEVLKLKIQILSKG